MPRAAQGLRDAMLAAAAGVNWGAGRWARLFTGYSHRPDAVFQCPLVGSGLGRASSPAWLAHGRAFVRSRRERHLSIRPRPASIPLILQLSATGQRGEPKRIATPA
jgi:hypothetical protein